MPGRAKYASRRQNPLPNYGWVLLIAPFDVFDHGRRRGCLRRSGKRHGTRRVSRVQSQYSRPCLGFRRSWERAHAEEGRRFGGGGVRDRFSSSEGRVLKKIKGNKKKRRAPLINLARKRLDSPRVNQIRQIDSTSTGSGTGYRGEWVPIRNNLKAASGGEWTWKHILLGSNLGESGKHAH